MTRVSTHAPDAVGVDTSALGTFQFDRRVPDPELVSQSRLDRLFQRIRSYPFAAPQHHVRLKGWRGLLHLPQICLANIGYPVQILDRRDHVIKRRITHAAITENKRLGAVLAHIKDEQDKASLKVKVKPVSAKNGYQKTGRRSPGRPSKMDAYYARKSADREARAASQSSDV